MTIVIFFVIRTKGNVKRCQIRKEKFMCITLIYNLLIILLINFNL